MNDNDDQFLHYLDQHFFPVRNLEVTPEQESGPELAFMAWFLETPAPVLREVYRDRGELLERDGVEHVARWQVIPDDVLTDMRRDHAEFTRAVLAYRQSVRQGMMNADRAFDDARLEMEAQRRKLAAHYRRMLNLPEPTPTIDRTDIPMLDPSIFHLGATYGTNTGQYHAVLLMKHSDERGKPVVNLVRLFAQGFETLEGAVVAALEAQYWPWQPGRVRRTHFPHRFVNP